MAKRYIAVVDAGSSHARLLLLDRGGDVAASGSMAWSYANVDGASPYAREFDAAETWTGLCELIRRTLNSAAISPPDIAAIAVTGQRQAVAFLDENGGVLYVGPNLDLRAVFEGAAMDDELGNKVYSTTGHTPSFLFAPAKARWLQEHRPEDHARVGSTVTLADWLAFKLSGRLAGEVALAGEAGLLDITERRWCGELLSELGVPGNDHIPLVAAGDVLGEVTGQAAGLTGLRAGTPVAVAGPDTQCGLVGMGLVSPGHVGVVAGWSAAVQMVTDSPMLPDGSGTWAGCHLAEDTWTVESSSGDAGNSYGWLVDTLWGNDAGAFDRADTAAAAAPPGAEGALAYLGASPLDMGQVGMRLGGLAFPVPITFSKPGKGHMARAALEAVAYATRAAIERVEQVFGSHAATVAVGGGMIRTPIWVRILADVLGRELLASAEPNVSARGAFGCAATAVGWYPSLADGAAAAAAFLRPIEPDPEASLAYEDLYRRWRDVHDHLGGIAL